MAQPSHPMVPRLVRYSVLAAVLLFAGALLAQSPPRYRPPRSLVTVNLEGEGGEQLRTYQARGQTFVLGHHGQRYNIRVQNRGPERVEVVLAVDGREAVSGRPVNVGSQRGYVIPAYGSVLVQGFRTSMESVAAFRFTDPGDSYAGRLGSPQQTGIIQVAVFDELRRDPGPITTWPEDDRWDRRRFREEAPSADSAPPRAAPGRSPQTTAPGQGEARAARPGDRDAFRHMPKDEGSNLGTQYGEHRVSRVFEVDFERLSSRPSQWVSIRYDDEQGLLARGIELYPRPVYATPPPPPYQPDYEPTRFAPPPPPRNRPWYSSWDW